ncbi:MAG: hypothetical protein ACI4MH_06820 [Candidatus Coproplasma sp.]
MELKKVFKNPQIEVIRFDSRDVITESRMYTTTRSYSIESIKDIFNYKVN